MYVVDRDFGFAPNPFHGCCTLATCMPRIRAGAQVDDWIIGMGGARLRATGRCVYAMRVTGTLSFNDYWSSEAHFDKRPVRNGSSLMMVGDNIYHREQKDDSWSWRQADSHHSNPDGAPNLLNLKKDTSADRVLLSRDFFYFGRTAPEVPSSLLERLGFRNGRNYRVFEHQRCVALLEWLATKWRDARNVVAGDPFDFDHSAKRYSGRGSSLQ
jgi:Nucleotide modification associated domain 2